MPWDNYRRQNRNRKIDRLARVKSKLDRPDPEVLGAKSQKTRRIADKTVCRKALDGYYREQTA